MAYSLLRPLQVGRLKLNNRLVMPPMATSKSEDDGSVSQGIIDYYREKSEGGYISLIIIEHSYFMPEGKASKNQLSLSDDCNIERLKELAEVIHSNGSKAVIQLNHAGSGATEDVTGRKPVGPSAVPNPRRGGTPHELTHEEIEEIVKEFGKAAARVKEAGFDGVEIHSAHGYLLNQFFSPITNKRTDEYGGDVKNRIRIHLEVIKEVRNVVGEDYPVLLRLGATDNRGDGTTIEDIQTAAKEFEKAGVDIIDVSGGFCGYVLPGATEQGYFSPFSEAIKKVVSVPVILTGGITDVHEAERLLQEDKADLIGVGRAILNNSNWAKEAVESIN